MHRNRIALVAAVTCVALAALVSCKSSGEIEPDGDNGATNEGGEKEEVNKTPIDPNNPDLKYATFAGGCFWCMEPPFEKLNGVGTVISGFTGGPEENPSYKDVAYGRTGHTEAVQVQYDPKIITYEELLHVFWRQIDPTQVDGQFVDNGKQYRTGIFWHDEEQKAAAEKSKEAIANSGKFDKPIVVEITRLDKFWPAEEYHQDFYKKEPDHYYRYRRGSGRDQFLMKVWGDEAKSP